MEVKLKTVLKIEYKDLVRIKRIKAKALARAKGETNAHGSSNQVELGSHTICYTVDPQGDGTYYKHISMASGYETPDRTVMSKVLEAFQFRENDSTKYEEVTLKSLAKIRQDKPEQIRLALSAKPESNEKTVRWAYHIMEFGLEEKEYPDFVGFLKSGKILQMETYGPDGNYTIL